MLTGTQEMLKKAAAGGYAVGAFNIENMEMIQAAVCAAEELSSPIILQTTPSTVKYGGLDYYYANVAAAARTVSVPVAIHLDHGDSFELCARAVREGYTSVMIDGSKLAFEENVTLVSRVVEIAAPNRIPVEAELGKVGGKEDEHTCEGATYTDPEEAAEFVRRTMVSSLAVAIGTAHGVYTGTPKLDKDRLSKIARRVSVPLVLHGASGLMDEEVRDCVKRGIAKVNFATELRMAFSGGVKDILAFQPDAFDPKAYLAEGRKRVKELVKSRIRILGCEGKA